MANKRIDELTVRNTYSSDLVPVANPATGLAGKTTISNSGIVNDVNGGITISPLAPVAQDPWAYRVYRSSRTSQFTAFGDSLDPKSELFNNALYQIYGWGVEDSGFNAATNVQINAEQLPYGWFHTKFGPYKKGTEATSFGPYPVGAYLDGMTNLQTLSCPNLTKGSITLYHCRNLTSFSAPNLVYGELNFENFGLNGQDISLPAMKYGGIYLSGSSFVTGGSFPELERATAVVSYMTSINFRTSNIWNFPKLKSVEYQFYLSVPSNCTSVSYPELEFLPQGSSALYFNNNGSSPYSIQTISCPKITAVSKILGHAATYTNLTSLSFPELVYCYEGLWPDWSTVSFPALTTINLPKYVGIATSDPYSYSVYPPVAKWTDKGVFIKIDSAPSLTSINLPMVDFISGNGTWSINIASAASLSTFTIKQTPKFIQYGIRIQNAALNQASVDGILVALAYMNGTNNAPYPAYSNKTVNLSGGTSATPSATGLAAKATLVARGCTVTHN